MGDPQAGKHSFGSRLLRSLVFIPIDDRQPFMPMQQTSWWQRCRSWFAYHSIQLRWDIERSLARRFNRRWGK